MKKTILVLMTIVVCLISGAQAAVVGPAGYTADFSTLPVPADWATRSITGGANGAADSTNVTQVGTNVAAIAASSITTAVNNSSPTNPPAAALASWTSAGTAFLFANHRVPSFRPAALIQKTAAINANIAKRGRWLV